jgi:hypothetical protein
MLPTREVCWTFGEAVDSCGAVPFGTCSVFLHLYPALPCRATIGRPSGACFGSTSTPGLRAWCSKVENWRGLPPWMRRLSSCARLDSRGRLSPHEHLRKPESSFSPPSGHRLAV